MRLSRNKIYKLLNGGKHQSRKKLKLQNNNNKKKYIEIHLGKRNR